MRPKSDEPPTLLDAKALRQEQEAVEHEIASLNEQLEATRQAMAEARARRRRLARALLLVDGEATAVKKLGRLKPVLSPDPTPTAAAPTFLPETRRGEAGRKKGDSRKDVRRNAGRRNHKAPPYEAIRRALVDEVAKRVPQPLDAFEIAAVIESTGITDSVAREDYGTEDVFELAECIFPLVLRVNVSRGHVGHKPDDPHIAYREAEAGAIVEATGRGLLALAPLALLLVAMQSLAAAGWTAASLLALSFGVTAAMLLTSGPILAIGHRTAIYLGFRYRAPATRFLVLGSLATLCACAVAAAALLGGSSAFGLFSAHERLVFAGALVAYGLVWLLVASLTLVGSSLLAVAALTVGLACGVGVGLVAGSAIGLGAGYAVLVLVLLLAWQRVYLKDETRSFRLPIPSLMALEAAPYVAFGSAFALFLIEPHALGWIGHTRVGRMNALRTLELSLALALPPVLLASGVCERILHSFWVFSKQHQRRDDALGFRRALAGFHRSQLLRYTAALGALSAAAVIAVELAIAFGDLHTASQLVFLCGIAGFFLLGLGQFNCLFMLSLSRPHPALKAVLAGVVFMTLAGVPLIFVDFRLAALAFADGAALFALEARKSCRKMIDDADHHFATAF